MKFYDREAELAALRSAVTKRPILGLVRGRRRVGKTSLILEVLKEKSGIYLYVDNKKNEKALLSEFGEILTKELALPSYAKVEKWEDLYEIIFSHDKLVVIDEFQRILDISPSGINQLQNYWDRKGQNSKAAVILSGSNVGMIKKIFLAEGAPLFKRALFDLHLKPLKFSNVREILNDMGIADIAEQIRVYAVLGGVPFYYSLLQHGKFNSWKEIVNEVMLSDLTPLKTEVRDTLVESFGKDHASYYAVISAIALGKSKKKEIADFSGVKETSISPYLYDLGELVDVIEYAVPVTEKKTWKSKQGQFTLSDNFFRFWFKYIFKNSSYYEEKNYEYLQELISKDFESFVGRAFEGVAREFIVELNKSGKLPVKFSKVGKWWNRKGDEVDVVLLSEDPSAAMLIECKWGKDVDSNKVMSSLVEKEKLVRHGKKQVYYGIIAGGFKSKAEGAMCFDLQDIDKTLTANSKQRPKLTEFFDSQHKP